MRDRAAQALTREAASRATDPPAPSWWTSLGEAKPVESAAVVAAAPDNEPDNEPDVAYIEDSWAEDDEPSGAYGNLDTPVSYTHLRAHETRHDLVCRLLLEKKKKT